jgi:hypothetical protein
MSSTTASVRNAGLGFGGLVAGVAALASYAHMRELAAHHADADMKWLSWFTPLSVDGLMVVSSIVIVQARRNGEKAPALAVVAIGVALTISLVANFSAPAADFTGQVINAWPAAAFAFAYELILKLVRLDVKPRTKRARKTAPAGAVPSPVPAGATSEVPNPRAADSDVTTSESDAPATAAPAVGTSLHIVAEAAPEWLTDDLRGQPKAAMWRYLDEHGEVSGAVLDRFGAKFLGTKPTLGRKVRRDWLAAQDQKASGE